MRYQVPPHLAMSDPRSRAGHAAVSIRGTDNGWIEIQTSTFLNWINQTLLSNGTQHKVENFQDDFSNGVKLCALVEALQQKKLPRIKLTPFNQHQEMENVSIALKALADDNVKLVNIGCEDVVEKNEKLILGLVWHLILKYQIGKSSKAPPKKLMMSWVQAVIPECGVNNFTSDWNSGIALHALVDYCKPGLSPNWRNLSASNGLENCRTGMQLAEEQLGIPQIMSPEDLNSPRLDDLSCMTYMSYFLKPESAGYQSLLRWCNDRLMPRGRRVTDFTSSWRDGSCLNELVGIIFNESPETGATPKEKIEGAYATSRRHGVEPFLTADEVSENEMDHMGNMAFVARLQHVSPQNGFHEEMIQPSTGDRVDAAPAQRPELFVSDSSENQVSKQCVTRLQTAAPVVDKSAVSVEVHTPKGGSVPATITWLSDDCAEVRFTPTEAGDHSVQVTGFGGDMADSDCVVPVQRGDLSAVDVTLPDGLRIGQPAEVRVDARQLGPGEVRAELASPSGRKTEPHIQEHSVALYSLRIIPNEPGDWYLHVWLDDELVPGAPFRLPLINTGHVRVLNPNSGVAKQPTTLTVDLSDAGNADVSASVTRDGREVDCTVGERSPVSGKVEVQFLPDTPGLYTVNVTYAGEEVRGSPFVVRIADLERVHCSGDGLRLVQVGAEASFQVHTAEAGPGELVIRIMDPMDKLVNYLGQKVSDSIQVHWVPEMVGLHTIDVTYNSLPAVGSPYSSVAYDVNAIEVKRMTEIPTIEEKVVYSVDASNAGTGNLDVYVIEDLTQHRLDAELYTDFSHIGKFTTYFIPWGKGDYYLFVSFNGHALRGSPFITSILGADERLPVMQDDEVDQLFGEAGPNSERVSTSGSVVVEMPVEPRKPPSLPRSATSTIRSTATAVSGEYEVILPKSFRRSVVRPNIEAPYLWFKQWIPLGRQASLEIRNVNEEARISIDLVDPWGEKFETDVAVENNNTATVWFIPGRVGKYRVKAVVNNVEVTNLTELQVFDCAAVLTDFSQNLCLLGEQVAVKVDTEAVGGGEVYSVVRCRAKGNQGEVPSTLSSKGNHKYRVSFVPDVSGEYDIEIYYKDVPVPGSPFRTRAVALSEITVSGEGVTFAPVRSVAWFRVDLSCAPAHPLKIVVTDPKGEELLCNSTHSATSVLCEWSPQEIGLHQISVYYCDRLLKGCPYTCQVYDISKVRVVDCDLMGVVDMKWHFTVDATRAGYGDVMARVARFSDWREGTNRWVSTSPKLVSDSKVVYEFIPLVNEDHVIEVFMNKKLIKDCPIFVKVVTAADLSADIVDATRVICHRRLGVHRTAYVTILGTKSLNKEKLVVNITGPNGENVSNISKPTSDGNHDVTFNPRAVGAHKVEVLYNDKHISGSPFHTTVFDSSLVELDYPAGSAVNEEAQFSVDLSQAGAGPLQTRVWSPSGAELHTRGEPQGDRQVFYFTPQEPGAHKVGAVPTEICRICLTTPQLKLR